MTTSQWLKLIAINLLVSLCIVLPFLPGPYDVFSIGLSAIAQVSGIVGLLLVPIGILWYVQERKRITGLRVANLWNNGYYFALATTMICTILSLFLVLAMYMMAGPSAAMITFAVLGFTFYKVLPVVRMMRYNNRNVFNVTSLYLISIPLVAFAARHFLIEPVSTYSRSYAIERGQEVIDDIENYYTRTAQYPESLDHLHHNVNPSIMGIDEFRYERNGDAYNLYFVQWQHVFATEEVVMYNKMDDHNVKGHFASYDAKKPHWKYYWLD